MGSDSSTVILITALIVSALLLIIFRLAAYFIAFNRETRYIISELDKASDYNEYRTWRRELRCHYLCLIPFVTERNVMRLYRRLFHSEKQDKNQTRKDGLASLLAPSIIGAVICAVCLCGASWAWFSASASTSSARIEAANYTVSVDVKQGEAKIAAESSDRGITCFRLPEGAVYTVSVTPTGKTTNGFCKINLNGSDYYTVQLTEGTLSFTVKAGVTVVLTVTPEWGSCTAAGGANTVDDGAVLDINPENGGGRNTAPDTETVEESGEAAKTDGTGQSADTAEAETSAVETTSPAAEPEQTAVPETDTAERLGDATQTESAETTGAAAPTDDLPEE